MIARPSDKQLRILQRIADGIPRKKVAEELHISEHTLKQHVAVLLEALAAQNASHAVAIGFRQGWIN